MLLVGGTMAEQVAIGCAGAIIAEALRWQRIAKRGRFPQYARSKVYWALTIIIILAGGFVASIVSPPTSPPVQLLLLGMVGPQTLSAIAKTRIADPKEKDLYLGEQRLHITQFLGS